MTYKDVYWYTCIPCVKSYHLYNTSKKVAQKSPTYIYAEFNQMLMFFDYHTELILKNLNVFLFHLHVYEEYIIEFQESK